MMQQSIDLAKGGQEVREQLGFVSGICTAVFVSAGSLFTFPDFAHMHLLYAICRNAISVYWKCINLSNNEHTHRELNHAINVLNIKIYEKLKAYKSILLLLLETKRRRIEYGIFRIKIVMLSRI